MNPFHRPSWLTTPAAALALALGALAAYSAPAAADDRNLLRTAGGDPYMFILLDTSGSMNWASQCTQELYDTFYDHDDDPATPEIRSCNYLCESGDCPTPRNADDPAAKMRQAREALYEVLKEVSNVSFGFATYNQDQLAVRDKHFLYRLTTPASSLFSLNGINWPPPGAEEVVGATFDCDRCDSAVDNTDGGNGRCFAGGPRVDFDDYEVGCWEDLDAVTTSDPWEVQKVLRWPKLGRAGNVTRTYYIYTGTNYWQVEYAPDPASPVMGSPTLSMLVTVRRCQGDGNEICAGVPETRTLDYELVGDFVFWDFGVSRNENQGGWFGTTFSTATETCRGWDPNGGDYPAAFAFTDHYPSQENPTDSSQDLDIFRDANGNSYSIKQETVAPGYYDPTGDAHDWRFWDGDVIPLNWSSNNKSKILDRLAPALDGGDPASNPEAFGQGYYFNDARVGTDLFVRLASDAEVEPIIANGSTPLAGSMAFFRYWYSGCGGPGNCNATGWSDIAAVQDPNWECRKKYLLVLTDGEETCDHNPGGADYYRNNSEKFPSDSPSDYSATADACRYVASMQSQEDIQTFVIAFGVRQSPKINCLSSQSQPFYVDTKQELVETLRAIFGEILEQAASFASAAVPSVQANVADKIYLSSFTPLNQAAIWPGRLDAFLKPLPLDAGGLPDRTQICAAGDDAQCFLWDAGDSQPAFAGDAGYDPQGLLLQAPLPADVVAGDNATLKVGTGNDERRIYFGLPNDSTTAGKRQYFRFPENAAEQSEFEWAWNLSTLPADDAANLTEIERVVTETLVEKQGEITDPITDITTRVQYVMGDIFHANPAVLNQPVEFDFYTKDLYRNQALCGQTVDQTNQRTPPVSYAYFADRNACRRKILFAASNDGQIHAFDTGIYEGPDCKFPVAADRDGDGQPDGDGDPLEGEFDNGTGREIFSFIPAQMMPVVRELTNTDDLAESGLYGIDGNMRTADVFIDPVHNGTPACLERQWRTVLVGSYREGGPGFFVLDITQPDTIDNANVPTPLGGATGYVPSCADGVSGCGPLPFPAKLWEFYDLDAATGLPADDDLNFQPDLGESWSLPVVGRIRVCTADCDGATPTLEERFVGFFGGGITTGAPTHSSADGVGNWFYIVDMETGRLLYKRGGVTRATSGDSIVGSVAADVTTVDFNNDGYVDTAYFGTTAGFVYKVDLGDGPFELDATSGRIIDPAGDTGKYDPYQVFSTAGRPVYYEIAAIYVPKLRAVALGFGTGDRWNLWAGTGQRGRFYVIADLNWVDGDRSGVVDAPCAGCPTPLVESEYQLVDPDGAFNPAAPPPDYLLDTNDATPGWFLDLEVDDRVITEAFSLSGITTFTAYAPRQIEVDGRCAVGGDSKIFVVGTTNAIGYARAEGATDRSRYFTAPTFTTQPFVEQSATQNPVGTLPPGTEHICQTPELEQVRRELQVLFPAGCRFAFYTQDIETVRSDTGLVCIAPVPVCIESHNWKEF